MRWHRLRAYAQARGDSTSDVLDELGSVHYAPELVGEYPARLCAWEIKDYERYGARALIDSQKIKVRGNPPPFVVALRVDMGTAYEVQEIERNNRYVVYMAKTVREVYI